MYDMAVRATLRVKWISSSLWVTARILPLATSAYALMTFTTRTARARRGREEQLGSFFGEPFTPYHVNVVVRVDAVQEEIDPRSGFREAYSGSDVPVSWLRLPHRVGGRCDRGRYPARRPAPI
jgi:hypothetical protein